MLLMLLQDVSVCVCDVLIQHANGKINNKFGRCPFPIRDDSDDCISCNREMVLGNSCAKGPWVYSASGATSAESINLTRLSYRTSISHVNRLASDANRGGIIGTLLSKTVWNWVAISR
jgi:hypothetical protein